MGLLVDKGVGTLGWGNQSGFAPNCWFLLKMRVVSLRIDARQVKCGLQMTIQI